MRTGFDDYGNAIVAESTEQRYSVITTRGCLDSRRNKRVLATFSLLKHFTHRETRLAARS